MRVVLNEDGGYLLDQEEAITYLLREHGNSDGNSKLAPIGSDCYEVHPSDGVLVEVKGKNGLPTVKEFSHWLVRCFGLRDAHVPTLCLQSTKRRIKHLSHYFTIGSLQIGRFAT